MENRISYLITDGSGKGNLWPDFKSANWFLQAPYNRV